MSLQAVHEVVHHMRNMQEEVTEQDKEFILQFAFHTQDTELTNHLMEELGDGKRDHETVKKRYTALLDKGENSLWVEKLERLFLSLEVYRLEEERAIRQLAEFLQERGIVVDKEMLSIIDTDRLREIAIKEAR